MFDTEPLPASSPLWALDNLLLSPHSADANAAEQRDLLEIFEALFVQHFSCTEADSRDGVTEPVVDRDGYPVNPYRQMDEGIPAVAQIKALNRGIRFEDYLVDRRKGY